MDNAFLRADVFLSRRSWSITRDVARKIEAADQPLSFHAWTVAGCSRAHADSFRMAVRYEISADPDSYLGSRVVDGDSVSAGVSTA